MTAALIATGAAAVITAPAAIPPPTVEPIAAIPDETAAAPTVPDAPATEAKAAPVVPAVADIIVAADAPATVDAVEAAVPAVAKAPAVPAIVDGLAILIFLLQIEQVQLNYLLNNFTTISLPW
ncbi:hypothetical protein ACRWFY_24860 [Escherichia coli]|jgi:hypothetical protein|uniref:Uncharacterized protein n=2 Tax=Escherichia coli TaxID=562 RepID=A0A6M1IWU7_ECOLX|nr:hypothetical protein [Escherichia coli]EIH5005330.1 hypothetical protein [Shigella boydii]EKH5790152.1 hypothetical protein [Escherichia coli O8]MED6520125.1 hypothetical protein [Escherichia coli O157]MED9720554.1 hypothetical protein [Escherichia marmotae]EED0498563.1 hypothetical protein [Escherichia coli]